MITDIADKFSTACAVVVDNSYDTCGTITRASIGHLTPADLEALFVTGGLFNDLDALFNHAINMKACGTKVNGLYDWIMSGSDRVRMKGALMDPVRVSGLGSMVQPFILAKQDSVFNNEFWVVSGGASNSAYTPDVAAAAIGTTTITQGPLTTADKALGLGPDRVIRLISRYGVELDEKWFNPRTVIHLFSRESGTGRTQNGAWRVLAAAVNTAGTYIDVLVTSENSGSSMPWAAAPISGVVVPGQNNVDDYESWCHNTPNFNLMKMVPFWHQTMRRTRCIDQFYKEFLKRMMTSGVNRAFAEFGDVDSVTRNRQDEEYYQRRFVNAFFFQKPWNSNQTLELYKSLPQITTPSGFMIDPGTGGKLIAYRANFIGVLEQLYRCDRVRDLAGSALNFYEWLNWNYALMRSRSSRKDTQVGEIDWWTSTKYAARINTAFMQYWKTESLEQMRLTMDVGNQTSGAHTLGFRWTSYIANYPANLKINIVTNWAFDDIFAAHANESQAPAGNYLLALDIGKPGPTGRGGSIYWAQLKANRRTSTLGNLDDLEKIDPEWACTMKSSTQEVTRVSETGTVVVECPNDNLWAWGIGDEPLDMGGESYPYLDLIDA